MHVEVKALSSLPTTWTLQIKGRFLCLVVLPFTHWATLWALVIGIDTFYQSSAVVLKKKLK